ncbi:MAG: hypothetical protein H0V51_22685 [Chloroflexi bacterium]|nr:hypothetical protein [Chloroflexota bacterium]
MADVNRADAADEAGVWCIEDGEPRAKEGGQPYDDRGVERLTYSNPFNLEVERVWFDGKVVYAVESGELDVDPQLVKVAQEYQVVYQVELDEHGKLKDDQEPERVDGQYNIYDSVPGMDKYSPIWQFNYVIVPRDYQANALRSEQDCLSSGYPVQRSMVFEN